MVQELIDIIAARDKEAASAIMLELNRQRDNIELIASENIVSEAVLAAAGSVLTNKYAEGYPEKRYYGGCEYVDLVENLAARRAKELFGAGFVNVQPHSGAQANYAAYMALCVPGDTVLGMDLDHGGHLTHGSKVNFSGKLFNIISYGVNEETGFIDYDKLRNTALDMKPKVIVAGASAYPRIIDFAAFSDIAKECGAFLMVDMAHIAGLIAAGLHPNPLPYADVVTTTTHKTLRGPRGGLILTDDDNIAKKINSAVFPGTQGGPLMHIIAAKAVALGEALTDGFKEYQRQVLKNAAALASELTSNGMRLVSGGTENHLMLLDLRELGVTGREMEKRLDKVHITVNKNKIPGDTSSPMETGGLRLGSPAVTTRGFKEDDMRETAKLIRLAATDFEASSAEITERVRVLCGKYPVYA